MHPQIVKYLDLIHKSILHPRAIAAKLRGADATPFIYLKSDCFQRLRIATVLDVGANIGKWAQACRFALPNARIVAFEPLVACYEAAKARLADDDRFEIYNVALGSVESQLSLNVTEHAASTSLLHQAVALGEINHGAKVISEIVVPVRTIDTFLAKDNWLGPILLKLDVQGYELEVLKGAAQVLQRTAAVVVETSFCEFYQRQPLFGDICNYLEQRQFRYFGPLETVLKSPSGLILQQDSLFLSAAYIAEAIQAGQQSTRTDFAR